MTADLEQVIEDFSAAEKALQSLVEHASQLQSTHSKLETTFATLDTTQRVVGQSHEALQQLASGLADTAAALRSAVDAAAEALQQSAARTDEAAHALRSVDPERLVAVGEETQAEVHKLGTKLQQVVEARTSAVTDSLIASVSGTRAEIAGDVRSLSNQLESNRGDVVRVAGELENVARRQTLLLVLTAAAVLLAGAAALGVFLA